MEQTNSEISTDFEQTMKTNFNNRLYIQMCSDAWQYIFSWYQNNNDINNKNLEILKPRLQTLSRLLDVCYPVSSNALSDEEQKEWKFLLRQAAGRTQECINFIEKDVSNDLQIHTFLKILLQTLNVIIQA